MLAAHQCSVRHRARRPNRFAYARRLGNLVAPEVGVSSIAASGSGPGPVAVAVAAHSDGGAVITCVARIAGRYSIAVTDASTGEALMGSPVQVRGAVVGFLPPHLSVRTFTLAWHTPRAQTQVAQPPPRSRPLSRPCRPQGGTCRGLQPSLAEVLQEVSA